MAGCEDHTLGQTIQLIHISKVFKVGGEWYGGPIACEGRERPVVERDTGVTRFLATTR